MLETTNNAVETEPNLGDMIDRMRRILIRHGLLILSVACGVSIAVAAVSMKLRDHYVSQATLLVIQQQVSARYVEPDSTTTIPAAVQAMKLEVLSRQRLLEIINEFGLYVTDGKRPAPELLVERMRQDVVIQPLETTPGRNDFDAFTISFTAASPRLAQEVTSRLTTLFIEQNLKTHGEEAASTTKFLGDQLSAAKQRLAEQEQRLQVFKTSNLGELPEQQQANLAALTEAREQLVIVTSNLMQIQQQQSSLAMSLNDRLARLQSERAALLAHYTPRYPDVLKKDREIAKVQAVLERLKMSTLPSRTADNEPTDDPTLEAILRQAEATASQIANSSMQQEKLKTEIEQYQKRLNLTPLREQQLAEILRDYDLYKQDYTDLLNKKLKSQMTTSLEENEEGQQFRLVDPASLPVKPSSPNRPRISLGGLGGGICLGLALAFLMDLRNSSFHNEKALAQCFSLPLVIAVPLVRTPSQKRTRRWRIAFEVLAGCVMIITMFAAEFYVLKNG